MTLNKDEKKNSFNKPENLMSFLLEIQSTGDIEKLFRIFLAQFTSQFQLNIKESNLAYHAGIMIESLTYISKENRISRQVITPEAYPDLQKDVQFKFLKNKFIVFKRIKDYIMQLELHFSKPISIIEREKDFELLIAIFFNQLYILLKIANLEFHSIQDDITLAYNQNYLKAFMYNEIERARRYSTSFSVIFFDLDHLKSINEAHGHLIGTEVLKEVADVLRSQIRKMDLLARFGGDEFVIILLNVHSDRAYEVCSRIKNTLNRNVFLKSKQLEIKITGSFGISSFPEDGYTVDDLIRKADIAMYEVKGAGKNGIKIYEGDK